MKGTYSNTDFIRDLLKKFMDEGDANACQITFGSKGDSGRGWYYKRFGDNEWTFMGHSTTDASIWTDEYIIERNEIG